MNEPNLNPEERRMAESFERAEESLRAVRVLANLDYTNLVHTFKSLSPEARAIFKEALERADSPNETK
jgi:hypothetical protein